MWKRASQILNVPRVVCFHEKGDIQYLLMTQITGVSGIHQDAKSDVPGLVRMFARGLREIHFPLGSHVLWAWSEIVGFAVKPFCGYISQVLS